MHHVKQKRNQLLYHFFFLSNFICAANFHSSIMTYSLVPNGGPVSVERSPKIESYFIQ